MTGERLREARKLKGWNQEQAARRLGVSQTYLSLLEKGKRRMPEKLAVKAIHVYELSEALLPVTSAPDQHPVADEGKLASELAALGYPGLSHLKSGGKKKNPAELLLSALGSENVELHCLGGFVVTTLYGLARSTADVDVLPAIRRSALNHLIDQAGKGSELHRKYGIYLDFVTVATVPEDYDQRLTEMFPGAFRHLRLLAFDPYDLALAKLERNSQRDRDDVKHLARTIPFDLDAFQDRYLIRVWRWT